MAKYNEQDGIDEKDKEFIDKLDGLIELFNRFFMDYIKLKAYKNIEKMIKDGHKVDFEIDSMSPLILASFMNDNYIIELLLNAGADINKGYMRDDNKYNSPLKAAIVSYFSNNNMLMKSKSADTIELLLKNGAKYDQEDLVTTSLSTELTDLFLKYKSNKENSRQGKAQKKDSQFNLYYKACYQNYRPEGNYMQRKHGNFDNINLELINKHFLDALNKLTMSSFISDINNYLCIAQEGYYPELWMYHTEAHLYNYLQIYEIKNLRWDEDLSKELLKSMVGYSKCIDLHSDSIIAYTNNISSFVIHILELITKILDILQKSNINCNLYNEILLEIFIFSVNLHYIFPIQEIFGFINDNIVAELDTRDSLSGKNEAVFKETKDHFEMLNNKGLLGENYTINMDYTIPDYTVVSDMWVHQQVENPMVTIIYIGILFSKVPSPIELEFCFYDKNNKEITLGKSISEKFKVKLGENVQRGGYYGYKITILNSIDIYGFKAKLLNTLNNTVYSSIELEKVNSNDTNGSTNDNDANESTNDGETLNNIAISATSNNSVSMDNSNIKNNSEPGVWIALLILFVGLFLIYRFAILNSKAITDPINDHVPIEQTIAAESVQFEFMNRLAERKKHGELEYISFIEDGYTDLFKDLNYDEILIGIVSTTGLNFRDNNTMDSNIKLILNEKEKIFIFGECDGWYFGINDVEDANETEYGWCSKYYIEAYVYNFNNKEAVPFEEYNN